MRYFLDTEFIEDGIKIDLISIGIVSEDGREYYAISTEFDPCRAPQWVKDNVLVNLPPRHDTWGESRGWKSRKTIAGEIIEFIAQDGDEAHEIWGEWCSYDWVAFCQLFGTMMDLPKGYPMRCRDVIQFSEDELGISASDLPESLETEGNHNALLGARTVAIRWGYLRGLKILDLPG